MTCTCPECGGTMIAGTMTRHDVDIVEFQLCFKCGLMKGKLLRSEDKMKINASQAGYIGGWEIKADMGCEEDD